MVERRILLPARAGGVVFVIVSLGISLLAAGQLGGQVRIRWSVGTHVGPEHAPAWLVLWGIPLLVGALYLGFAVLGRWVDGDLEGVRGVYELAVAATLAAFVAVQLALVIANLV